MTFLCGAARERITPTIGTCLYGYRPNLHSTSIHDDLTLTAAAFGNGCETALLVSASLGDIQNELSDEIRGKMAEACGIDVSNVIFAGTHTHCAPNVSGMEGWGEIDRPYVDSILLPAAVKAAKNAVDSMCEAEVGSAVGESKVGVNRRQQMPNGAINFGQNPWGCYDPYMTVLCFRRADSKQGILNLIHYGCHGTACGASEIITQDWPGMMIARTEQQTGTLTVFCNGAIGDVGPRLTSGRTSGDITHVEELGSVAAFDALAILRTIRSYSVPSLAIHRGTVHLPYQQLPPLESVQKELAGYTEPEKLININRLRYQHLKDVEACILAGKGDPNDDFHFAQTLLCVGDTVFVPFPFEMFSEICLRLRAYSGYQHTLCLSGANGYNGYLPTEDQLCRGGYEVGVFRYTSLYALADNTDQHIIDENLRILEDK